MSEESKIIYKTGASVADIKEHNATLAAQPAVATEPVQTPQEPTTPAPATVSEPAQPNSAQPAAEPVVTPTPEEKNVANVSFNDFETPAAQPQSQQQSQPASPVSLDDELKKLDRKEILKKLGISDFAIEMDDYMKGGGKPVDYLSNRAIDYNTISDESLVKSELKKQFSGFTETEIERLLNRKYQGLDSELQSEKDDALLQLRADAHLLRQQKITEQQKFKIPEPLPVQQSVNNVDEQAEQQAYEQAKKFYTEHADTQSLMTSKRVAIDLGDDGKFNFNIDKPEMLTRAILENDFWTRITSVNPKETDVTKLVPNVALQHKLALIALNPNYERDLVNYGKTLALPSLVDEGRNAKAPANVVPMTPENKGKVDWNAAKTGKVGG